MANLGLTINLICFFYSMLFSSGHVALIADFFLVVKDTLIGHLSAHYNSISESLQH